MKFRLSNKHLNIGQFSSRRASMDIKTFVFLDSETTGLPYQEANRTRITELSLIAVQSEHLSLGVFPRVQNKLNFCFNPKRLISPEASRITGLSNDILQYQTEFNYSCFIILREFLNVQRKPVCLIAHNGNRFDYPILKAEIHKSGNQMADDIFCVDSLLAFRSLHNMKLDVPIKPENVESNTSLELEDGFDDVLNNLLDDIESISPKPMKLTVEEVREINETTPMKKKVGFNFRSTSTVVKRKINTKPSFALGALYQRLTSKEPVDAHHAECDVNMLIECVATVGQPFIDWCNLNVKRFCDIPMMEPGKAILS